MSYVEHTHNEAEGFDIISTTQVNFGKTEHLIWVGIYGEGRWLSADEAERLAGAIFGAAAIHRARVDSQEAA